MDDRDFYEPKDDGIDLEISAAFRAVGERPTGGDELALRRLSASISGAAKPSLEALRLHVGPAARQPFWRLRPRVTASLAFAAAALIAVVLTQAPQSTGDQAAVDADTGTLLFNVMMKNVRPDDAARALAVGVAGANDLWTRMDD